jgi:heat shock protein HslJ
MKKVMLISMVVVAVLLATVGSSASGQNKKNQTANAPVTPTGVQIAGTKWKLVELHGQVVVKAAQSKEDAYLLLNKEGTLSAYTGCNNMTGSYTIRNGMHIKFSNLTSTRMACPDMKTEQILNQVLQAADGYSIKGKRLTLTKTGTSPLAIFETAAAK